MARKILLADDSVTAQNMGRKILTDAGYEVITVNNGSAALKKIAEGKPDLIVLDVYMPGYSGLEVCQRIKENRETARIPILLTVGKLEPFKPEEARRARADAFVVKPFEASELLSALTKLEDKIVPGAEPYKPGRFAKAIASVEREADPSQLGESDEGWKARLRIPTGTPRQADNEPPIDYSATQGKGFRDIVEPAQKATSKPAAPSTFERPIPAGLPHDITSEEIAAITAAAAQLRAGASVKHEVTSEVVTKPETNLPVTEASSEETVPVTFASAPELDPPVMPVEAPPTPENSELPVAEVPVEIEQRQAEAVSGAATEPSNEQAAVEVSVGSPAVEISTSPSPQGVVAEAEAQKPAARPGESAQSESAAAAEAATAADSESATLANSQAPVADDEVMAALHALIPTDSATGQAAPPISDGGARISSDVPSVSAEPAGPRWIAEEVTLSQDEASLALDREMEMLSAAKAVQEALQPEPSVSDTAVIAVATAPDAAEPPVPEVYAVATAAGAEFPVPWPLTNPSAAAEVPIAQAVAPTEIDPEKLQPLDTVRQVETQASIENDPRGGTEIMAASWKNIRDSIAGSAAKPAPAKEEFAEGAATGSDAAVSDASPAESTSASDRASKPSAGDPTAIANIVESVLAELRPKIVEEITRKLSDPKK